MCVCVAVFGSLSSTYITVGWLDCGWTVAERIREHRQATVAFFIDQTIRTTSRWTTPSWTTPQPCLGPWTTPYCSSFWTKWVFYLIRKCAKTLELFSFRKKCHATFVFGNKIINNLAQVPHVLILTKAFDAPKKKTPTNVCI